MALKGKEVATKAPAGKRKKDTAGKSGGRKRRNPGVLQFFDVAADVHEKDDDSDENEADQDFLDQVTAELKNKNGHGKAYELPILPKEEELSGDELERYLEEKYKTGSHHVVYAGDECETKGSAGNPLMPSVNDPTIWRIKCMVGRERQIVFSLIQKYVDLRSLGTKLKIVSAFTIEHMKGYVFVEAERQSDVLEACKGLCNIYFTRISPIASNEVSHLFSVRNTTCEVSIGTWARVKYGKYKGDLAQVVAADDTRKSAVVKLIPRINLQALSKKLAGGGTVKESAVPAPRMITSSELEELRPHIKIKTERLTGKVFETIDGLMLKDGHLYKKVFVESLQYSGVVPSAEELQKFETSNKDESEDMEWLSQLFGEKRKKRPSEKGTGKGEGTSGTKKRSADCGKGMTKGLEDKSGTKKGSGFQLHDLVFFGQNDFGVIIGTENDNFQILKGDVEGAEVVNVDLHEIKSGSLDEKFTTLDKNMLKLSLNDTVRVSEGALEGKQGVVRHICKGTIFIYDENQQENSGYFCVKSQFCENISHSKGTQCENDDGPGIPIFGDSMTSPNSPELPSKKRWAKDDFNSSRRGDQDGTFSIGQTLRIKVGPLKGHLCRVIAIYRSDVTVKLDSQMKVITVKCEHLSEAGVKSIRGCESNFAGTFDGFGTQGPSGDALDVSGATTNNSGWNSASLTTRRNAWPNFSSEFLLDSTLENPFGSLISSSDQEKDKGDDPWGSKATDTGGVKGDDSWGSKTNSKKVTDGWGEATDAGGDKGDDPWGSKTTSKKVTDGWGKSTDTGGDKEDDPWGSKTTSKKVTDGWGKATDTVDNKQDQVDGWGKSVTSFGGCVSTQWGSEKIRSGDETGCSKDAGGSWEAGKLRIGNSADLSNDAGSTWDKTDNKNQLMSWDKGKGVVGDEEGNWGKSVQEDSWSKAAESQIAKDVSSESKQDCWNGASAAARGIQKWGDSVGSWTQPEALQKDHASGWNRAEGLNGSHSGSWGKGKDTSDSGTNGWKKDSDSLSKPKVFGTDGESSWSKGTGKSIEDDPWGKVIESSKAKEVSIENKKDCWNQPAGASGYETWGKSAGSWSQPESVQSDQESGWNKTKTKGSCSGNWGKAEDTADDGAMGSKKDGDSWSKPKAFDSDGALSWSQGTAAAAIDSWNKPKGNDGDQEYGWSKGKMDGRESYGNDQSGRGDRPRTFDGGRGSGGRRGRGRGRGRGGNRGGNRDHFNRGGRSFGQGQSSDWNRENHVNDWSGAPSGNSSSGWNGGQSDGCNKAKSFGGDQQPNWDSATQNAGGNGSQDDWKSKFSAGEKGDRNDNWNSRNSFNASESSGWEAGEGTSVGWKTTDNESGGNQSSGWDSKAGNPKGDHSSGWDGKASDWKSSKGNQPSGWDDKASNWSNPKSNLSSGWVGGTVANDVTNISNEGQGSGWNSNWSSQKDSSGTLSSAWGKKPAANEEANGIKDQADGWKGRRTSEDGWAAGSQTGGNDNGGGTGWGSGSSGWGTRANETENEGQSDTWSRKSFDNNSSGGNWRGGKSFGHDRSSGWNRGSSDNNNGDQAGSQYRKRDFGGRGPNRGGSFGNRGGRGRRGGGRSGGWNREQTYGGDSDGAAGASSSDHVGICNQGGASKGWQKESSDDKESWNQWDASKGQWRKESGGSSKDGSGGDGNQTNGWNSQGSAWNGATGAKESGGWKSEAGSGKEDDGTNSWSGQSSGWQKESSDHKESWNQGGYSKGQWQKESDGSSKNVSGGDGNQSSGWNSQGSGWNRATTGTKESGGWESEVGSRKQVDGGSKNWSSGGQASGSSTGRDSTSEGGTKDQGGNWNQSQSHASWNKGAAADSTGNAATGGTGGGWNKEAAASSVKDDGWNRPNAPAAAAQPSSGWNKTTDAKEEANENECQPAAAADPWGKASVGSSWGKGGDGKGSGSKGGW